MDGPFENLIVWQRAMELVRAVYALAKKFPADERYALTDQLRRAVASIPSNIAEGRGRDSAKDFAHFLMIARGSLNEVATQLELAVRLGYMTSGGGLYDEAQEVRKMLNAMIRRLRHTSNNEDHL